MDAPFNVTASQVPGSFTSASIAWSAVAGATGYIIYRSTAPLGPFASIMTTTSTQYTNTGIVPNTTYYYNVTARDATGEGPPSATVSFRAVQPLDVTVQTLSATELQVDWTTIVGATSYEIARGSTPQGSFTTLNTITNTSYIDSGLEHDTTYYYRITANNGPMGVGGGTTDALEITVEAEATSTMGILVSWAAVPGATGYTVGRSLLNGNYQPIAFVQGGQLSYQDGGLTPDTIYWYQVTSSNGAVGTASAKTLQQTLTVTVVTLGAASLEVRWNAITGATSYTVERSLYDGDYQQVAVVLNTTYTDANLAQNTTYWYRITANNGPQGIGSGTTALDRYSIQYNNLMGASNTNPAGYTVETPTIVLADPGPLAGYVFLGWYTAPNGGVRVEEIPQGSTGDVVLYARWEPETQALTVTFYGNDPGGPPAQWIPFPIIVAQGEDAVIPDAIPTRERYRFIGWNTQPDGSGTAYQPGDTIAGITQDIVLYAQWVPETPVPPEKPCVPVRICHPLCW